MDSRQTRVEAADPKWPEPGNEGVSGSDLPSPVGRSSPIEARLEESHLQCLHATGLKLQTPLHNVGALLLQGPVPASKTTDGCRVHVTG